jgi:drug/metabolite transporter (DMT)-like permease
MIHTNAKWPYALLLFTPALWAVNYLVARLAPGQIAPHMLALCRWALAGAVLAVFAWPELKQRGVLREQILKHGLQYLALGALGMWICGAWVYIGARSTSATNIALIYALSPVLLALSGRFWLKERLGIWQWLGVAVALAGLVHVVIKGQWSALGAVQFVVGDIWILACTLAWTLYALLLKKWQNNLSQLARLVLIIAGGVLILLPLAALEAWSGLPLTQTTWNAQTLLIIVAAGLFPGAGAYLAFSTLQKHLGAARAGLTLYLGPLYAAVAGWVVLGEPIELYHLVGAAVILPGIYLASRKA